jgi:hypothetical protein
LKPIRESQIEKYLVAQIKTLGGVCRKLKYIGCRNAPDRVIMLPRYATTPYRRPIWVELKAPGKKPTSGQLREHERMRGMGQRVEVIDSFEGVDKLIGEMK